MSQQVPRQKQQQPLDSLQSMINGVLIETGKALRSANKKGARTIGHTNIRLQAFIPSAIDKFHLALDELESDIVRAQAVLSRDLREIRQRQYELDNPTIPVPEEHSLPSPENITQLAAVNEQESENNSPQPSVHESPADEIKVEQKTNSESPDLKIEDIHMSDSTKQEKPLSPQSLQNAMQESQAANNKSLHDDLDMLFSQHASTTGLGIDTSSAAPSAASEAPATGGLQSMNFDSLFSTEGNGESNDINFDDLDFSGDGAGNNNLDFGGNDGDMDLSSFGEQVQATTANNDDVSAMLQMDNFGNSGGDNDFSMLDLSNTGTQNNNGQPSAQGQDDFGMGAGDLDAALDIGNNESNFDDLLDGIDFGEDADNGTGGDLMEHGEFDDAFFGISDE